MQIASDDAESLSWPWEALRDPRLGTALAHACHIERRLGEILDTQAASANLRRVILPQLEMLGAARSQLPFAKILPTSSSPRVTSHTNNYPWR